MAVYLDRIKSQEDIQTLLNNVFADKDSMDFEEFRRFNCDVSSEMFLAIFVLLNSSLPCAENFTHFKRNYKASESVPDLDNDDASPKTDNGGEMSPIGGETNNQIKDEVTSIASPTLMRSLSPLSRMGLGANFTNTSTASMGNVNLNPNSQKIFL